MANQYTGNNSRYITAPSLGDLTAISSIRVVCKDVIWTSDDGYLVSQAGSSNANRTYGLYRISGRLELWFLGAFTNLGNVSTLFGSTDIIANTLDLYIDRVAMTFVLQVDGGTVTSGTLTTGSNPGITGMLLRWGARASDNTSGVNGTYFMNAGDYIGDTDIYIDGVLVRSYVMPSGVAVTVPDIVSAQDGTLRNAVGDGSDWTVVSTPLTCSFGISPNRIYQRAAGTSSRNFAISGTYSGDTTSVQYRLMASGVEITGWTSISIAAGTFSTSVSVPTGGPYTIEVRARDAGSVTLLTLTSSSFLVGDVIGVLGSSSPQRWFSQGSGTPADARSRSYRGSAYEELTNAGSCGLENALYARTGIPTLFIERGFTGTTLEQWANSANSNYVDFMTFCAAHDNELAGVICLVGYNDAYDNSIVDAADHETMFANLVNNIRGTFGYSVPVFIVGSQRGIGRSDTQWRYLYEAEVNAADPGANVYYAVSSVDLPVSGDNIHLTDAGYATQGARAGDFIGALLEGVGYELPAITAVVYDAPDTLLVGVSGSGTLTPASPTDITGFSVSDDNFATTLAISSVRRVSDSVIQITHAAASAIPRLRYQFQANPVVTEPAYRGGLTLIPQPTLLATEAAANVPPELAGVSDQILTVGTPVTITLSVSDPDSSDFVWSVDTLPTGLSLNTATGVISGTVSSVQTLTSTVTVSDGEDTDSITINWTITATPEAGMSLLWMENFANYGLGNDGVLEHNKQVEAEIVGISIAAYRQIVTDYTRGGNPMLLLNYGSQWRYYTTAKAKIGLGYAWIANPTTYCLLQVFLASIGSGAYNARYDSGTGMLTLHASGNTVAPVASVNVGNLRGSMHHWEIAITSDATNGYIEIRLDEQPVLTYGPVAIGAGNINSVSMGTANSSVDNLSYFTDVYVWDGEGTINNTFLGDRRVGTLRPNADVSISSGTVVGAATGWDALNDEVPDDDTTYVQMSELALPKSVEFDLPAVGSAVGQVAGILLKARAVRIEETSADIQLQVAVGGASSVGTDKPILDTYSYVSQIVELNPNTAARFTGPELASANLRITRTS